jgi:Fe-Mn family superoxide dismutase
MKHGVDTVNVHAIEGENAVAMPRRRLLAGSVAAITAGMLEPAHRAWAQEATGGNASLSSPAFAATHEPVPLPFDASSLNGLSARLIESHWSNNYGGSVRALNETNRRLAAALEDPELPAFTYNDLKREHLLRTGSVVLHELYFGNLGGDGRAAADVRSLLASAFGSYDRWESEFRRIGAGLGGGSGWVMLGYNRHFQGLENYWMADHAHGPAATVPLLVMDMYEHSYQMDYGAATARYVDAFFANINWDTVGARIEAIRRGPAA